MFGSRRQRKLSVISSEANQSRRNCTRRGVQRIICIRRTPVWPRRSSPLSRREKVSAALPTSSVVPPLRPLISKPYTTPAPLIAARGLTVWEEVLITGTVGIPTQTQLVGLVPSGRDKPVTNCIVMPCLLHCHFSCRSFHLQSYRGKQSKVTGMWYHVGMWYGFFDLIRKFPQK
uniref:Uncharacterized protein n=1 Tax=Cacopsylla melanoneura TaxID=428564 RepID=A0A8D8S6K5_9HEMI